MEENDLDKSSLLVINKLEQALNSPPKLIVHSRHFKFDPEWVQVLINLRMKHAKLFTRHRNSASEGWKLVFQELKEAGAPDYISMQNIKKKWMNLMARYRQIKNSYLDDRHVTWPYYEQINRAFGTTYAANGGEDKESDSSLLNAINNDERQSFIRKLIQLRYNHKHLFTGKKYTARYGWMIIRTLLQCEDRYTVEQLSKCWQNLVQRYKQLLRSETIVNITWPYFTLMHDWFNDISILDESQKLEMTQNIVEGETNDTSLIEKIDGDIPTQAKPNVLLQRINDNLSHIKAKQDLVSNEILRGIKNIESLLNESNLLLNNN